MPYRLTRADTSNIASRRGVAAPEDCQRDFGGVPHGTLILDKRRVLHGHRAAWRTLARPRGPRASNSPRCGWGLGPLRMPPASSVATGSHRASRVGDCPRRPRPLFALPVVVLGRAGCRTTRRPVKRAVTKIPAKMALNGATRRYLWGTRRRVHHDQRRRVVGHAGCARAQATACSASTSSHTTDRESRRSSPTMPEAPPA